MTVKKFILVHGEGFGAWCWYKTIASLEESGLSPVTVDLAGSGFNMTDANSVSTLEEYSKPLIELLQDLPEEEKVRIARVWIGWFMLELGRNVSISYTTLNHSWFDFL